MKLPLKLLIVLLALALLLFVAGPRLLGGLVATAVREGGEYALGTPTELDSAKVDLNGVGLSGLSIQNPAGFRSPAFLTLGEARLEVDLASLRADTVVSPLFALDDLDLHLERSQGKTNYGELLEHLRQLDQGGADAPSSDTGGGKAFRIDKVRLRGVTAHLDLLPIGGEATQLELELPEIELDDVGSEGAGASIGELFAQIVQEALQATIRAGGDAIPSELLDDLRGQLQGLEQAVGAELGNAAEALEGEVRDALDEVEGRARDALQGLGKKDDG